MSRHRPAELADTGASGLAAPWNPGYPGNPGPPAPPVSRPRRCTRADLAIMAGFLVFAVFILNGQWLELRTGYLYNSAQDQNMWEWFFAVTARNVVNWDNPLSTGLANHPLGVNLMANTAMLGLGIPLTPVTLVFGPTATWALALTGGLAGTAIAWYWVFSRHLVTHRAAAAIGAGFCGFAPAMISHANAHPNFVAWWLLPFIALRMIRIATGTRPVRDGLLLGLLMAYQIFLGEEPLLIGVLALVLFALAYAASRPREVPRMLAPAAKGLGVAAALALLLTAYPLWWQFFGPQSYQSLEHGPVGNDTAAFTRFATESVAGDASAAADVSLNRTEENAFLGWPLIVLLVVITVWLWRDVLARALAVAMFLLAWLSLGSVLTVAHTETGVPGPWALLAELPLFESVLESRFAMGCVPLAGALLALATQRVFDAATGIDGMRLPVRLLWLGTLTAVLLPVAPTPLEVVQRGPTPAFFVDGTWRAYVDPGGTVVTVPLPGPGEAAPMHWQVQANLGYPIAEGYFVGPSGPQNRRGRYGAVHRPTARLLTTADEDALVPMIDEVQRTEALADLRYWNADVVVLPPRKNQAVLSATVESLLRTPARSVDGVLLWDVRAITR